MLRREIKEQAQEYLMQAMQAAWNYAADAGAGAEVTVDRQMIRIEKLFGYEPGSWMRGV